MDDKLTLNEVKVLSAIQFKEMYGLEIIKTVKEEANTTFYIGTLYNLLSRMEKKGYVESRWGDDEDDGRGGARRRYYNLTGAGASVLNAQKEGLIKLWELDNPLGMA